MSMAASVAFQVVNYRRKGCKELSNQKCSTWKWLPETCL